MQYETKTMGPKVDDAKGDPNQLDGAARSGAESRSTLGAAVTTHEHPTSQELAANLEQIEDEERAEVERREAELASLRRTRSYD